MPEHSRQQSSSGSPEDLMVVHGRGWHIVGVARLTSCRLRHLWVTSSSAAEPLQSSDLNCRSLLGQSINLESRTKPQPYHQWHALPRSLVLFNGTLSTWLVSRRLGDTTISRRSRPD